MTEPQQKPLLIEIEDIPWIMGVLLEPPAPPVEEADWPLANIILVAIDLIGNITTLRRLREEIIQQGKNGKSEALTKILKEWITILSAGEEDGVNSTLEDFAYSLNSNGLEFLKVKLNPYLTKECADAPPGTRARSNNAIEKMETETAPSSELSPSPILLQETLFSNSLILEAILKNLSFKDRKVFRLLNAQVWLETLSFWRRTTWLMISVSGYKYEYGYSDAESVDYHDHYHYAKRLNDRGITMKKFMELTHLQQNQDDDDEMESGSLELDFTFSAQLSQFYSLSRFKIRYTNSCPFSADNEDETSFWRTIGPTITHLWLSEIGENRGPLIYIIAKLLLETCPNLEELRMDIKRTDIKIGKIDDDWKMWEDFFKNQNVVQTKLQVLSLDFQIETSEIQRVLSICPNLKDLSVQHSGHLNSLVSPEANGELIRLQSLSLGFIDLDGFLLLRKYIGVVPNTLRHFELKWLNLPLVRNEPFHLYYILAQCQNQLKTLKLGVILRHNDNHIQRGTKDWFTDLSIFRFPNLTQFKLEISYERGYRRGLLKFDFGTLKGMRQLEQLELCLHGTHETLGSTISGSWQKENWICPGTDGQRKRYIPQGVTLDHAYSESEQILCPHLKNFTFNWKRINSAELGHLTTWFPNLHHLGIRTDRETLPAIVQSWRNLKTLLLDPPYGPPLSLNELRSLGTERLGSLKIIQNIQNFGKIGAVVEVGGMVDVDEWTDPLNPYFNRIE